MGYLVYSAWVLNMLTLETIKNTEVVTVIGGQGFVGRALAKQLENSVEELWIPQKNDPRIFERDLGKVFYCAGLTADYLQRPYDTINAHISFLSEILSRAKWKHLVYLSSARVYDGLSGVVDETADLNLNPNNPRHLYDLSKLMGESICLQTGRASIARLSCVYCDDSDEDGFLPELLRRGIANKSANLIVESSPYYSRDYVHLHDVIDALIAISNENGSTIYNVASGQNVTNSDIFSILEVACNLSVMATQLHKPADAPEISIEKIQHALGWQARKVLPTIRKILNEKGCSEC